MVLTCPVCVQLVDHLTGAHGTVLSYLVPLFQNESLSKTCHVKMSFICMKFHLLGKYMNGLARRLVLTQRQLKATLKWLILHSRHQRYFQVKLTREPFLEGPEKFSHPESHSKISNLMITELFIHVLLI